ncbi:MAG: class II aldolase/adducin family protein [Caldiserica bacterium]|nr:class II aldolase/adducin family protein [Caldisericota bacterium]
MGRAYRELVCRAARRMWELGLVTGSAGNVSLRAGGVIYITPSAVPYDRLRPHMIIALDPEGRVISGAGAPSTEWRMHVLIHRELPEARAVIHTHSPCATAAAARGILCPVCDEGRLLFGGAVPVSDHVPPGTWELAHAAVSALRRGRGACLLARHGALAVGWTLTEALRLAVALEETARIALLGSGPQPP